MLEIYGFSSISIIGFIRADLYTQLIVRVLMCCRRSALLWFLIELNSVGHNFGQLKAKGKDRPTTEMPTSTYTYNRNAKHMNTHTQHSDTQTL